MQFKIEQVAFMPQFNGAARALLEAMGLTEWVTDYVKATGTVGDRHTQNEAHLHFNYQAESQSDLEVELLEYVEGDHWLRSFEPGKSCVSHIGMHCTEDELDEWKAFFANRAIPIAQEVNTTKHSNPYLVENGRKYHYCIFNTRGILGVDVKFIVRIDKALADGGKPEPNDLDAEAEMEAEAFTS